MGIPVLILGESGSGKSASLRNFDPAEVGIFNVASKPLPFRKALRKVDGATYATILQGLASPKLRCYVIDDSQYLLAFASFDRAQTSEVLFVPSFIAFHICDDVFDLAAENVSQRLMSSIDGFRVPFTHWFTVVSE